MAMADLTFISEAICIFGHDVRYQSRARRAPCAAQAQLDLLLLPTVTYSVRVLIITTVKLSLVSRIGHYSCLFPIYSIFPSLIFLH